MVNEAALNELTSRIIGCAYHVSNELGTGYLEKIYENAMGVALRKAGLQFAKQVKFPVLYQGEIVGDYYADLIVEGQVLVEVKAVKNLDDAHVAQCLNYLAATKLPVCLLINFQKTRIEIRRLVGRSFNAESSV